MYSIATKQIRKP